MKRLAITIAVLIVALYTPAFSDNSVATQINNGSKLLLKAGSDSLFYVYWVSGTGVKYARSEGGVSWSEETVVSIRDCPAIAADSTGKRWIAVRQNAVGEGDQDVVQEVYYRDGQSWVAETLYSALIGNNSFGPPSIAGASSTTTGIVYVAFLKTVTGGTAGKYLILTKFDGTAVDTVTVASGGGLGDPAVTVEPYKTDSDHVYVTWENNNVIKYCMDTDGRSSGIADKWTAVADVSNSMFVSHHPSINSRRDAIVVAWAQGSPPDIYARRRLSGIWGIQTNQSGTPNFSSDYPTIALGDATVVAWEEANSASDHDILGRVDFASSITIHNCNSVASYPHATLQLDGLSLYLHTIWSEPDYAVGYNSIDLWAPAPEGPQSASSGAMLTEPSLAACLPNPFHGRTQISYALPAAGSVDQRVCDAAGRTVRTLASGHQTAGNYSVSWDARDAGGRQVPCGVYFYRLDTPGFVSMKQAVVTR